MMIDEKELTTHYHHVILPAVQKDVLEFRKEMDPKWMKERKVRYLCDEISKTLMRLQEAYYFRKRKKENKWPYYFRSALVEVWDIKSMECNIKKLRAEKEYVQKGHLEGSRLTEDKILLAKQYDVSRLLKFDRRGFMSCPYHNEKTASMKHWKKQNLAHCFGCGVTKDSIQLVVDLQMKSFPDAVRYLNELI